MGEVALRIRLSLTLRHPELRALYDRWLRHCAGETFPVAADIDPIGLRRWSSHLVLIDVVEAGNFVYAYYSRSFTSTFGADKVGLSIDALPAEQARLLKTEYDHVCRERLPVSRTYTADFDGVVQTWERLVLPFFDPEGNVVKLLVAAYELVPS